MDNPTKEAVAYYDAVAEDYAQLRLLYPAVSLNLLERFVELLREGRILDVGCGPGPDAKFFSGRGFEVVGIDLSGRFLEIAREVEPRATFLKMDMRALGFAAHSFDGLWACGSLIHVPKAEVLATLRGFRRILKPGGLLFLSVKEGKREVWAMSEGEHRFVVYYYQVGELRRLVEEAGFEIVSIDREKKHTIFINVFARS